jgi:hypothetical protein
MACLPFPQGCRFALPVSCSRTQYSQRKTKSRGCVWQRWLSYCNTTNPFDFIDHYFFSKVYVAKLKHRPKNPMRMQPFEIKR